MQRYCILLSLLLFLYRVDAIAGAYSDSGSVGTTDQRPDRPVLTILPTTFFSTFVGDSIRLDISLTAGYYTETTKVYRVLYAYRWILEKRLS